MPKLSFHWKLSKKHNKHDQSVNRFRCPGSYRLYYNVLISTMVESGSEIVFNQMLFDRSLGAMRKGFFTAPVEGYWRFDMQLALKMLSSAEFGLKYQYEIEVLHNNKVGKC